MRQQKKRGSALPERLVILKGAGHNDMAMHATYRELVAAFLAAVNRSDAKLALLTTFDVGPGFENTDIGCASGGYRPQSLTAPPFSLPPPLRFFSEEYPTDPRVGLGLWKIPFFA